MMVGNPSLSHSLARAHILRLLRLLLFFFFFFFFFFILGGTGASFPSSTIYARSRGYPRGTRERREAGARTFDTSYNAGYVRRAARSSVPANNASVYIPMMSYTCDCACAHELSRGIIDDFLILHFREAV